MVRTVFLLGIQMIKSREYDHLMVRRAHILYPLDKDWGKRLVSGSRQSRDLPVDNKKLVIRLPTKENIYKKGDPQKPNSVLLRVFLVSN